MGDDARVLLGKLRSFSSEVTKSSGWCNSVRMVTEDVVLRRIELRGFDQLNREEVSEPAPNAPRSHPMIPASTFKINAHSTGLIFHQTLDNKKRNLEFYLECSCSCPRRTKPGTPRAGIDGRNSRRIACTHSAITTASRTRRRRSSKTERLTSADAFQRASSAGPPRFPATSPFLCCKGLWTAFSMDFPHCECISRSQFGPEDVSGHYNKSTYTEAEKCPLGCVFRRAIRAWRSTLKCGLPFTTTGNSNSSFSGATISPTWAVQFQENNKAAKILELPITHRWNSLDQSILKAVVMVVLEGPDQRYERNAFPRISELASKHAVISLRKMFISAN